VLGAWAAIQIMSFGTSVAAPPPPAKVLIIGLDGVSLNLLRPYAETGVTPNLARLIRDGASGPLESIWPLRTPQVWTTVVTGKYPGQHGIWDHRSNTYFNPPEFREPKGRPLTTADRRSKALWNILGDHGHHTLSVGWVASWPAENIENAIIAAPTELRGDRRQTSIKPSFYRGAARQIAPAALQPILKSQIVDPLELNPALLTPFGDMPDAQNPLMAMPMMRRYVYGLTWSLARAISVEQLTHALHTKAEADLALLYFQCSDSLLHRFWIFQKSPERIGARLRRHGIDDTHAKELKRRFGGVVDACYRDLDERIGRILTKLADDNTLVMVISDHGFGNAPIPHRIKDEPYSGAHLDDGVIIARGPTINPGTSLNNASVLDITPTVLRYFGLPVARDMPGKPLAEISPIPKSHDNGNGSNKKTPRFVESYESAPQTKIPYRNGWPLRR